MKISIRKSKHQSQEITGEQTRFAAECAYSYLSSKHKTTFDYTGQAGSQRLGCEVYATKTTVAAVVYFKG